jgi:hypothetical protein
MEHCLSNDDYENLEDVLKLNIEQKHESDLLLDKFNKLLEDNKNDCNNLNQIFVENKTKFSQDIEYIEILMDKVRGILDELVEKHKQKEILHKEESNRQLLEETIRETIMNNFEDDILNKLEDVIDKKNILEETEEEEEEESDTTADDFINDEGEYEESEDDVEQSEGLPASEGSSLLQSGTNLFSKAFNKIEGLFKGTSLFQLPTNEKNNVNQIFVELSFNLNNTPTERQQIQYLLAAHQKMKLIIDNIYVSLKELYDSYQDSSHSCKQRLTDFTKKRNEVLAANLLNQLEIEKIGSNYFNNLDIVEFGQSKVELCQIFKSSADTCDTISNYCDNYQSEYNDEIKELDELILYFNDFIETF